MSIILPRDARRRVALIDLDHTVSDAFRRDWMIDQKLPWDDYHAALVEDLPISEMVHLVNALHVAGFETVGLTARPAKWRDLSTRWFVEHGVMIERLLMREAEDYRPSAEMKVALAQAEFGPDLASVAFVLDNRDDVLEAFRALGVITLQVSARR